MTEIPMAYGLILGGILFALGLAGLLMRRNLLFILVAIEIMLNGAGVAFVSAGSRWGQPDGEIMFLFILAMAASEVSVGLALILRLHRLQDTVDADAMNEARG
jgi:NADH-quinone oxidoreductase subunit K